MIILCIEAASRFERDLVDGRNGRFIMQRPDLK
jgi:hypothetical protein